MAVDVVSDAAHALVPPAVLEIQALERARAGDPAACRSLVLAHQGPVFALIGRMLGPQQRSLVPDLAQETFLRIFRALDRFRPDGPAKLSTWILTIASRIAIDALRRRPRTVGALPAERDPGTEADLERIAERRRLLAKVEAALAELTPEYRAAFLLRAYHDLDYDEIASALALNVGTVKSRIARAREQLRSACEEDDHGWR